MDTTSHKREAWNKGKLVGQKPPLKPKDIWAIRIHLQLSRAVRDLALFNLAIDSKLRGCDLVSLHVRDVTHGNQVLPRAMVIQSKTQRPGRELTTCLYPAVRPDSALLGRVCWPGPHGLWHPFDAADQGHPDLQADEKPQSSATPAGSRQVGKHRALLGHRGG